VTRRRTLAGAAAGCLASTLAGVGCTGDEPAARPTIVAVSVQRCAQPNAIHGVGVVVGDDLVATAGHVVEGDLRRLEVIAGGATVAASVVAIDRRRDLALLAADVDAETGADSIVAEAGEGTPTAAAVVTPDTESDVTIDRHVTQVVDHATDRTTYRRDVLAFAPALPAGSSGAPLLDRANRLVGVVIATLDDETYAVTAEEVAGLVAEHAGVPSATDGTGTAPGVVECDP
jgi:S1-C subfamily serine protease